MYCGFQQGVFLCSICLTYPMLVFPIRDSVINLMDKSEAVKKALACYSQEQMETRRFYGVTVGILLIAYTVACVLPKIEVVFELVGSTFGTCLCYVIPGSMYIKASQGLPERDVKILRMQSYVVSIVGGLMGFIALIISIVDMSSAPDTAETP